MRPLIDRLRETAHFSEDGGLLMEAADTIAAIQQVTETAISVTHHDVASYPPDYAEATAFLGGLIQKTIAGGNP